MELGRLTIKTCEDLFLKIFSLSSIHGFSYVVRRDFHKLERLFWLIMVIACTFGALYLFSGQLKRYNENPTVLEIEILTREEFARPSFTICSEYTQNSTVASYVERTWGLDSSSENYQLYMDFVVTVSKMNYLNLNKLQPFADNPNFNGTGIDFLQIALEMKKTLALATNQFTRVITEMGICQSSTQFHYFQNPYFKNNKVVGPEDNFKSCSSLEVCRTSVSPNNPDHDSTNKIFIHNYNEVMSADATDYEDLQGTKIIERTMKIDQIVAEETVIKIKPKSRKCLFESEPRSKYFNVYTRNLCKIDCRIKNTLKLCNCVPFFYAVDEKPCDINGLVCLSNNVSSWYYTPNCECPSLCETIIMTKISTKSQDLNFDRMLTIDLVFPKTRIVRSVLFNFEDLVVGFGGSVALFLGFSFLTGIEIIYFVIEYFLEQVINVISSRITKADRISKPQSKIVSTRAFY